MIDWVVQYVWRLGYVMGVPSSISAMGPNVYKVAVPGVDSASNRNEYQEYFLGGKIGRCVGLTNLPRSCDDCLEIWEPQTPGTPWACPGL
jgi:hypothetical protein